MRNESSVLDSVLSSILTTQSVQWCPTNGFMRKKVQLLRGGIGVRGPTAKWWGNVRAQSQTPKAGLVSWLN